MTVVAGTFSFTMFWSADIKGSMAITTTNMKKPNRNGPTSWLKM